MNRISILLGIALLVGCTSDKEKGLEELKRLCEKDAGVKIYKTVEAEGYYADYSSRGWESALIKGPYKFYEYCNDTPSKFSTLPEPGCFRLTRVDRESKLCHKGIDQFLFKLAIDPFPEFVKTQCISVRKIDKPEALYKLDVVSTELNRININYSDPFDFSDPFDLKTQALSGY